VTDRSGTLGSLADADGASAPLNLAGDDPARLREQLAGMVMIRAVEETIGDGVASGAIRCPCHLAIGQEAPPVALARYVQRGDRIFGAHRSHGHFLALGGSVHALLAEVLGKETGCSRGMGGSMHLRDVEHGLYGTVPIVAATVPIAAGAALAATLDGSDAIAVSFLGDGATEEGVFHETLNLAATMKLPIVFIVENNFFSSHLHIRLRQPFDSICRFGDAHGIPWQRVDGNDVPALNRVFATATNEARHRRGPQLVEAITYRWRGHVGHREDVDVGVARQDNLAQWKGRDPIARLAAALEAGGYIGSGELERVRQEAVALVAREWQRACDDPYPAPEALLDRVYYQQAGHAVSPPR
jgi:TPP-dependent pyruvate/acetoin dehydrogenase alpha subunit